ncbi:hypothetical protein Dimus_015183, partial [Dionaea muscipula]
TILAFSINSATREAERTQGVRRPPPPSGFNHQRCCRWRGDQASTTNRTSPPPSSITTIGQTANTRERRSGLRLQQFLGHRRILDHCQRLSPLSSLLFALFS